MVPNCVKKVQHLRLCLAAVYKSFTTLGLYLALLYKTSQWKKSLVLGARKWGLNTYLRHALIGFNLSTCSLFEITHFSPCSSTHVTIPRHRPQFAFAY